MAEAGKTYQGITWRLLPDEEQEHQLYRLCGACRKVWNVFLGRIKKEYKESQENGTPPPSTKYEHLSKEFKEFRNDPYTECPWLKKEHPSDCVRRTVRELSQAFRNYFAGRAGYPRFRAKHRTKPSFTIPQDVKIKDGKIHVPKIGKVRLRRRGENPYSDGVPKQARVYKQGNKWYVSVNYEIDEPVRVDNGVTAGIDRNASGMIAVVYSDDTPSEIMDHPAKKVYESKERRYQCQFSRQVKRQEEEGRTTLSKRAEKTLGKVNHWKRERRKCRHNRNHQSSAKIAGKASTVKVENLSVQGMTGSAGGTEENPGTNVRQKAGLNRVFLEGTSAQLVKMPGYKCLFVVCVVAAYTSQTCSLCGHVDRNSRATLRKFVCLGCGFEEHVDLNAAANILRAPGHGASGRRRGVPIRDPGSSIDLSSVPVPVPS